MLRFLRHREERQSGKQSSGGTEKIFYISLQRCGTKSFSRFFRKNGYVAASWNVSAANSWSLASLEGRYLDIVESEDYRKFQVFEDGPWHHLALVRFLYWAEPNSRFVYFTRPFEDWMSSMKKHSDGLVLGDPKRHCMVYDRLGDYYSQVDAGVEPSLFLENAEEIYARAFRNHALGVRAFFEDKPTERFFQGHLYDKNKFEKLSEAWSIDFKDCTDVHVHRSGHPFEHDFANSKE